MGVSFRHRGNFKNTERLLKGYNTQKLLDILEYYGRIGALELALATPKDSGLTADSWGYRVSVSRRSFFIIWENTNVTPGGTPIAILLQYGHGTKGGSFVQGQDYINPAIRPIMDKIAEEIWREVVK